MQDVFYSVVLSDSHVGVAVFMTACIELSWQRAVGKATPDKLTDMMAERQLGVKNDTKVVNH